MQKWFRCNVMLSQQRRYRNGLLLFACICVSTVILRALNDRVPKLTYWRGIPVKSNDNKEKDDWDNAEDLIPDTEDTKCDTQLMSFPVFHNKSFVKFGRRFPCDLIPYLEKFELLFTDFYENSLDFQDNEIVFVTYASGNHFAESKMGVHTLRTNNFTNKIIFYDLGLSLLNIEELQGVCNLEIRVFNYTAYPKFVRNLYGYHFKPIIIADIFREFKAFWIIDASARFTNLTNWKRFNDRVRSGAVEPFALRHPSSHSIFAATHNEMYNYLPLSTSIARNYSMFEANTMFVVRSDFAKEAVKWNLLCALTKECMNPPQSKLGCNFASDRFGVSAGCHRYDQSCINVIVANLKHRLGLPYQGHNLEKIRDSFDKFASIKRGEDMTRKLQHFKC